MLFHIKLKDLLIDHIRKSSNIDATTINKPCILLPHIPDITHGDIVRFSGSSKEMVVIVDSITNYDDLDYAQKHNNLIAGTCDIDDKYTVLSIMCCYNQKNIVEIVG